MYRKLDDFYADYQNQIQGTTKVFSALTDTNLGQAVAAGHRTLGGMAWHIVTTVAEMMGRTGLKISSVDHESQPPGTATEIQNGYEAVTADLMEAVMAAWQDETLTRTDDMYGQQWQRGQTLRALISHEAHHRGQMTVLLRQAGVQVPGIYGPAKEEWSQYGLPEPPY